MKQYFLFDLDGTVTDTGEGIMKSAQYALDAFGIHQEPEKALRRFVGPPLHLSFQNFYGLTEAQSLETVGAGYGYAFPGELEAAGADHVVFSVPELEELLLSMLE